MNRSNTKSTSKAHRRMGISVLYAMPNHLRPCLSHRALAKGKLHKPQGFKDRVYFTDVGEAAWDAAIAIDPGASIKLHWRRGYFPWKIGIRVRNTAITLKAKKYGESSWSGAIAITYRGDFALYTHFIRALAQNLGRKPYETPYWGTELWNDFYHATGVSKSDVVSCWEEIILMK